MRLDQIFEDFVPHLDEVGPDAPGAEDWIDSVKGDFKKRYGKRWKEVLYATAWKKFGSKAKNTESVEEDQQLVRSGTPSPKLPPGEAARRYTPQHRPIDTSRSFNYEYEPPFVDLTNRLKDAGAMRRKLSTEEYRAIFDSVADSYHYWSDEEKLDFLRFVFANRHRYPEIFRHIPGVDLTI